MDAGFFKFLGLEGVADEDVAGGAQKPDDGVVLADGEGLVESGEAVLFNEVPPGEVAEVIGGRADKAVAAGALGDRSGLVEEGVFWGEIDGDGGIGDGVAGQFFKLQAAPDGVFNMMIQEEEPGIARAVGDAIKEVFRIGFL